VELKEPDTGKSEDFGAERSTFLCYAGIRSDAISLSGAWNCPRRSSGGIIASIASNFSVGSARRVLLQELVDPAKESLC